MKQDGKSNFGIGLLIGTIVLIVIFLLKNQSTCVPQPTSIMCAESCYSITTTNSQGCEMLTCKCPKDLVCSTHYYVYEIKEEKIIPEYLILILRSGPFLNAVESLKASSIKNEIGPSFLLDLRVYVPSLIEQQKIVDQWNKAQQDAIDGKISPEQLGQEREKYNSVLLGIDEIKKEIPEYKPKEWLPGGKKPEMYKSGRIKDIERERDIRKMYEGLGIGITPQKLQELASGYQPMPWIQAQARVTPENQGALQYKFPYGKSRNLVAERNMQQTLISKLGRIPKPDEVNAAVYGSYPLEIIRSGKFDKFKNYYQTPEGQSYQTLF